MLFSKVKKKLYRSNCLLIKKNKVWCFKNVFFKKRIIEKIKKGQ